MRVLVACEFSGVVRDAFLAKGHDAMSCDLLPTEIPGPHYQGDVFDVIDYPWDLMIAHPPCDHLSVSGARWFEEKKLQGLQQQGVSFFMKLAKADIPRIALENPVSVMSTFWRKRDQQFQPWNFHGETESKAICLWLKNLPQLRLDTTEKPEVVTERVWRMAPGPERKKERSRFFPGVAKAMAEQWGNL